MHSIGSDVLQAIRRIRRHTGFSLVAVGTLALGIGASTSVFTVVDAVLVRPMPLPQPERLFLVGQLEDDGSAGNVGWATWRDWSERATSMQIAAYRTWGPTLLGDGAAERLAGLRVSWNFFEMLEVRPVLGRSFAEREDAPDTSRVVVLSDALWRSRLAADPEVVGSGIVLNDNTYTVIGVMPADFAPLVSELYNERAELWAPIGYDETLPWACRTCQHLQSIGRLEAGVASTEARAELDTIQADLRTRYPDEYTRQRMTLAPFQEEYSGRPRPALAVLAVAVALVLLIACANVASLFLARAVERERELAVRAALGASRGRLARLLAIECGTLAGLAGLTGLTLAIWGVDLLVAWFPVPLPGLDSAVLDRSVALITLATTVVSACLVAIVPAARATGGNARSALRDSFQLSSGRGHQLVRRTLVVGNVAIAFVLVSAAGLLLTSVYRLLDVDPGFDARGVLTAKLSFVGPRWADDESVRLVQTEVLERIEGLPGVERVAFAGQIPLGGNRDRWGLGLPGRDVEFDEKPSAERYSVTSDYFELLAIPVLRGRGILASDRTDASKVIVVGQRAADELWPGEDPAGLTSAIRGIVAEVASGVPVYDVAPMEERVARTLAGRHLLLRLISVFAAFGFLLSVVGLHGVLAFTVASRTREIGIRVALGANRGEIVRLVLSSGIGVVAFGALLGLIGSSALGGVLSGLLFGVEAGNAAVRAVGVAVLVLAAVPAHALPAWRAARIDPGTTLRAE